MLQGYEIARRALTVASIDCIKPPAAGQAEHFDKGFPWLALRISYGGGKSFVFFYRAGGKLKRLTSAPNHLSRSRMPVRLGGSLAKTWRPRGAPVMALRVHA